MKTVLLFRHAKSDWIADYDDDHDWPLASPGQDSGFENGEIPRTRGRGSGPRDHLVGSLSHAHLRGGDEGRGMGLRD